MPGIWTPLPAYRSISRHIEWMFRIRFVLLRRPERTAFRTGLPRTRVAINVVGIAQRKAFVLILAAPPTSKRQKCRIAAYPLLATRGLHQRHRGIPAKAAMLTGNGLGFQAIVSHHVSLPRRHPYRSGPPCSLGRCITPRIALSSWAMLILPSDHPSPTAACLDERARHEPIVQSPTKPKSMETQSHAAS